MPKGAKAEYTFLRTEKKYLLTGEKFRLLNAALENVLIPDKFPHYTLKNIYLDTPDDFFIRTSIEKPDFKEKIRLRSYGSPAAQDTVFLEIKRKVGKTVGKRRIALEYKQALDYITEGKAPGLDSQIFREIDYLMKMRHPVPRQYISYERIAYTYARDKSIRITFDTNIIGRRDLLVLDGADYGESLLDDGAYLMELKVPGVIPIELSGLLSSLEIYPTSFSKYGELYKKHLCRSGFSEEGLPMGVRSKSNGGECKKRQNAKEINSERMLV